VVRITLPVCPDFDIEEDETVPMWIPASALKNSTQPIYAGSFVVKAATFKERIDNAILALEEEHECLGQATSVPSFIFTFFTCEIVAKSIVGYCKFKDTGRKSLPGKWSTKEIENAINELEIGFDSESIRFLFSEEQLVASQMSARVLRDNIVHRMRSTHRKAVKIRYVSLMEAMQRFLDAVKGWRDRKMGE
jgi:hypothetical protein